jgi:Ser/Thr protein kinase RdoA (MazF antagonist)
MITPESVISAYFNTSISLKLIPFGNGHIQSTYKVDFDETSFILQKINAAVFTKPEVLISNHLKVLEVLGQNPKYIVPQLLKTKNKKFFYKDEEGGFWRLMEFVANTYSLEKTEKPAQAFEAGKAYGWFAKIMQKADVGDFEEAIPQFHSLSLRLKQFEDALQNDLALRKESVRDEIDFFLKRKDELLELEKLIINGEIPKRIVHNDTKINNVLFKNEKAVAVIDLDTTGPGTVLYDYGDALRTIANTADEDEEDLKKVKFSFDNFSGFTKGYLSQTASFLTKSEKENLHLAPVLMTYIIGLRFLTDFLNGDVYFKTSKPKHNLLRSRVQMKLIEKFGGL